MCLVRSDLCGLRTRSLHTCTLVPPRAASGKRSNRRLSPARPEPSTDIERAVVVVVVVVDIPSLTISPSIHPLLSGFTCSGLVAA